MLSVAFVFALCVGLGMGAIPGITGIIIFVRNCSEMGLSFIILYLGLTVIFEFIFIFMANSFFDCGMQNGKQLGSCFYMYLFLGASPGFSLFLALAALFFRQRR